MILHIEEPICNPLYAFGSDALTLDEPFQMETNLDFPQDTGIKCFSQMSLLWTLTPPYPEHLLSSHFLEVLVAFLWDFIKFNWFIFIYFAVEVLVEVISKNRSVAFTRIIY